MYHGTLWQFSLFTRGSWDLHSPSPSLMRAVIMLYTGPDNPANEDECKMKKLSSPLRVCVAVLITELDNMSHTCHPQALNLM